MKQRITITLDTLVAQQLKTKPNLSRYINDLVLADLYEQNKDTLVQRTLRAVLDSSRLDQHIRSVVSDLIQQERSY